MQEDKQDGTETKNDQDMGEERRKGEWLGNLLPVIIVALILAGVWGLVSMGIDKAARKKMLSTRTEADLIASAVLARTDGTGVVRTIVTEGRATAVSDKTLIEAELYLSGPVDAAMRSLESLRNGTIGAIAACGVKESAIDGETTADVDASGSGATLRMTVVCASTLAPAVMSALASSLDGCALTARKAPADKNDMQKARLAAIANAREAAQGLKDATELSISDARSYQERFDGDTVTVSIEWTIHFDSQK